MQPVQTPVQPLATDIVTGVRPSTLTPAHVAREFRRLIEQGATIKPAGSAREDPASLLTMGYTPKHKVRLFETTYYLTNMRYDDTFRFLVAYVLPSTSARSGRRQTFLYPRLFYKDASLVWRSPTHYARSDEENWIGKGDVKRVVRGGVEGEYSAEETTDLPLEIQFAMDDISRRVRHVKRDDHAVELVLRRAPDDRIDPYVDFSGPRRRAMKDRRNLINGGRDIARFERENDPESLRFVPGFDPDFRRGVLEIGRSKSRLYGGTIRKYRILSKNKQIHYQFVAAPRQTWIIPPQALTTAIMSYGVRTVDVNAPEDLFVPGYEYHYLDDTRTPQELYSQIPPGYAGNVSRVDTSRADASPWLERLPVVQEFKRHVLRRD